LWETKDSHPYKTTGIIIILYFVKKQLPRKVTWGLALDLTSFLRSRIIFLTDGAFVVEVINQSSVRSAVMLPIGMLLDPHGGEENGFL
jgi:hypothetical protein